MRLREIQGLGLAAYPVGAIYFSLAATSPADLFGGTWERIQDMVLMAAGATYGLGTTGGAAAHKHTTGGCTLTVDQIPSHTHSVGAHAHTVPAHGHGFTQPTVNGGAVTNGITGGSHGHEIARANDSKRRYWSTDLEGGGYGLQSTTYFVNRGVVINNTGQSITTNQTNGRLYGVTTTHTHSLPAHAHSVSGGAFARPQAGAVCH